MKCEVVDITPELARKWLENNCVNRTVTHARVEMYARDMTAGKWLLNGEPIVFNKDGKLVNGQHRLTAIIKCGLTIKMLVIKDVENADGVIYDRGRSRNTSDTLVMNGVDKYIASSNVTGMIRLLMCAQKISYVPTDTEVQSYIEKYSEQIKVIKKICCGKTHNKGVNLNKSVIMGCMFCAYLSGVSPEVIEEFVKVIYTGFYERQNQTPAVVFRNDMINKNISMVGMKQRTMALHSCEKALYDYVNKAKRKKSYAGCDESIYTNIKL